MQSNFPKIPLFFSTTFFVLSCLAFLFFYKAINNNNTQSQLKEGEWQIEAQKREEIKTLDRSVQIISVEKAELETHFAQSSDVVPFLDTIEGLASKASTKAEVTSVDISEDHLGLLVGMKASGSFENLYKFLTLLENSPYELEFVSMDMSNGAGIDVGNTNVKISKWNAVFKIKLLSFTQ